MHRARDVSIDPTHSDRSNLLSALHREIVGRGRRRDFFARRPGRSIERERSHPASLCEEWISQRRDRHRIVSSLPIGSPIELLIRQSGMFREIISATKKSPGHSPGRKRKFPSRRTFPGAALPSQLIPTREFVSRVFFFTCTVIATASRIRDQRMEKRTTR